MPKRNHEDWTDPTGPAGTEEILTILALAEPPFVIATTEAVNPGDIFQIGGQPFIIKRIATRQEFEAFALANNFEAAPEEALRYIEVVTD